MAGNPVKIHFCNSASIHLGPAVGVDGTLPNGEILIGYEKILINGDIGAEAGTLWAGTERVVEGEHRRLQFGDADTVFWAGIVLGERHLLPSYDIHNHDALRDLHGSLHGVREAALNALFDHEAIHDEFNIVLDVFLQFDFLREVMDFSVHPNANKAGLMGLFQRLCECALFPPGNRCQNLDTSPLREFHDLIHDLVHSLGMDFPPTDGTVGNTDPGIQKTEVIIDFRDGSNRGSRVLGGRLLVNGDGWRKALNGFHIGLFHEPQELTGIGG